MLRRGSFNLGRISACLHTVNPQLAVGQLRGERKAIAFADTVFLRRAPKAVEIYRQWCQTNFPSSSHYLGSNDGDPILMPPNKLDFHH
jgi:hypothetical protein